MLLKRERGGLEKQIRNLQKVPYFGSDVDSGEEEAEESEEFGNKLAAAQVFKERLKEVNRALDKIDAGKYGFCEKCGQEISKKLLFINPESRLCQDCKKKAAGK